MCVVSVASLRLCVELQSRISQFSAFCSWVTDYYVVLAHPTPARNGYSMYTWDSLLNPSLPKSHAGRTRRRISPEGGPTCSIPPYQRAMQEGPEEGSVQKEALPAQSLPTKEPCRKDQRKDQSRRRPYLPNPSLPKNHAGRTRGRISPEGGPTCSIPPYQRTVQEGPEEGSVQKEALPAQPLPTKEPCRKDQRKDQSRRRPYLPNPSLPKSHAGRTRERISPEGGPTCPTPLYQRAMQEGPEKE